MFVFLDPWDSQVLFYITMLPLLFWVGELQLARQATSFMATCIYVGNAVKDAISAPRPDWSKGVRLVRDGAGDGSQTDEMEYGLPSTHTINTLCMWSYVFYYYSSSSSYGDGFSVYLRTLRSPWLLLLFILNITWCLFMMHGRVYLGMHSPIDIVAGLVLAVLLLHVYIQIDDFIDAWMTATTAFVPAYQLAFASVLCWTYPRGLQKTPSYNYAVYFTGVCLGVVTGVWRCPHHHSVEAAARLREVRGPFPSVSFFVFGGRRFLLGLVLVLLLRAVTKEVLKILVPAVLRLLSIPHSDHEAQEKAKKEPHWLQRPDTHPTAELCGRGLGRGGALLRPLSVASHLRLASLAPRAPLVRPHGRGFPDQTVRTGPVLMEAWCLWVVNGSEEDDFTVLMPW
ncbi:unnamed protein product [Durusdinium trenchii]|uniref:Phosphatidic acid phosphatase type 2/haloperoxidase domain-containing protein n=1 Tax=Durusdinium trenchii TaxID=1381693 RepID=A0ABP0NWF1_9DINO